MQGFILRRREELKLDILESLARSQKALARMLEGAADVAESSESVSRELLHHLDVMARCQIALAEQIAGIRLRTVVRGTPVRPWYNQGETPAVFPAESS